MGAGRASVAWSIIGWVFLWLTLMGVIQRGCGGYLWVLGAMLAVVLAGLLSSVVTQWVWAVRAWVIVPAILAAWIWISGSYSYGRDVLMIGLATVATILGFPKGRQWLFSEYGRLRGNVGPGLAFAPTILFQICWLAASSLTISLADRWAGSGVIERHGGVVNPPALPDKWKDLRVGLALSGGGYRAALLHAGVLNELKEHGVPVTNLSTVSGGSIIGGFVAAGGGPKDFLDAVKDGRFRFTRDLTWTWNLLRLPAPLHVPGLEIDAWPFETFSRIDVQQGLLDRVLLGGVRADQPKGLPGPGLIVNMTDLRYGLNVGFTDDKVLLFGPIAIDHLRQYHEGRSFAIGDVPYGILRNLDGASSREEMAALSRRAAVSGAFPGAFPVTEIDLGASDTRVGVHPSSSLKVALADGGIRDNLGLTALQMLDFAARTQGEKAKTGAVPVDPNWKLDMIIVSDGGQALQAPSVLSALASIARAIDLNGLETGVLRAVPNDNRPPVRMLSPSSSLILVPELIISGNKMDELLEHPQRLAFMDLFLSDTLLTLAELAPYQAAVAPHLSKIKAARQSPGFDPKRRSSCEAGSDTPNSRFACAQMQIQTIVASDILRSLNIFRAAPTLKDDFTESEADAIFRLGQYLGRLNLPCIQQRLDESVTGTERNECAW